MPPVWAPVKHSSTNRQRVYPFSRVTLALCAYSCHLHTYSVCEDCLCPHSASHHFTPAPTPAPTPIPTATPRSLEEPRGNLTWARPSGWGAALSFTNDAGRKGGSTASLGQQVYVSWAITNDARRSINEPFWYQCTPLFCDRGQRGETWSQTISLIQIDVAFVSISVALSSA